MTKTVSFSVGETKRFAAEFARDVLGGKFGKKRRAFTIALSGELGAGKTTFVQGFARGLGLCRRVQSPTFVFVRRYALRSTQMHADKGADLCRYADFYHVDAYRVRSKNDLRGLGLQEFFMSPRSLVLVEWAENVKGLLPKDTIWVRMKHGRREHERIVEIAKNIK